MDIFVEQLIKRENKPLEKFMRVALFIVCGLMAGFSVRRLHYVGTDMATHYMRQTVDEMDEELYQLYLRYHFTICTLCSI